METIHCKEWGIFSILDNVTYEVYIQLKPFMSQFENVSEKLVFSFLFFVQQ